MGSFNRLWCCLLSCQLLIVSTGFSQDTRQKLVSIAESYVGVREATDHNDGPQVQAFLAATGLKGDYPWCAAFQATVFKQAGVKAPLSAYCPDWFKSNVVYSRNRKSITPYAFYPAQVFGLYFESKQRVAHVGMLVSETKTSYSTIEGNTNAAGSREGDGVYRKLRSKKSIYVISDYVPPAKP